MKKKYVPLSEIKERKESKGRGERRAGEREGGRAEERERERERMENTHPTPLAFGFRRNSQIEQCNFSVDFD
jgi:hypothetical protein